MRLFILLAAFLMVLPALSATRGLDKNWHFTQTDPAYEVQWPPLQVGALWQISISTTQGNKVYEGFIADPNRQDPLATSNRRGAYTYYRFGQPVKTGHYGNLTPPAASSKSYWPNGKLKQEQGYTDAGRLIAKHYRENGKLAKVEQLIGGKSRVLKRYYDNGQLHVTRLPDSKDKSARLKKFYQDGTLNVYSYTETRHGKPQHTTLVYGGNGLESSEISNAHRDTTITYLDGRLYEKDIHDPQSNWYITRYYGKDGQPTSQQRILMPAYVKDGKQFHTDSAGVLYTEHYNKGTRDGLSTAIKDGKLLARSRDVDGNAVGSWFQTDIDRNTITFGRVASKGHKAYRYTFDASLIKYDADGVPQLPSSDMITAHHTLPPVGTGWLYQHDGNPPLKLVLDKVGKTTATFSVMARPPYTLKQTLATYASPGQAQGTPLKFPLVPGKQWTDHIDTTLKRYGPDHSTLSFHYRASAHSQVLKVMPITLGAGTFTVWVVDRHIRWTKDHPKGRGAFFKHMKGADVTVSGATRNILWYAPSVGRVVLKAHKVAGGTRMFSDSPHDFIHSARTALTELVGVGMHPVAHKARLAHQRRHHWRGFKLYSSNNYGFWLERVGV